MFLLVLKKIYWGVWEVGSVVENLSHKCWDLRCDPKSLHEARQDTAITPELLQRHRRKQGEILEAHGPGSLVIPVEDKRPRLKVEGKD